MKNRSSSIGFLVLLIAIHSPAQDIPRKEFDPERLAEELFPVQNLDLNYEELYENWMQRLVHPIDLNQATEEELRSCFILSENQIASLLSYRLQNGPLLSLYELQSVPALDLHTISRLVPFVTIIDNSTILNHSLFRRIAEEKNSYFIARYEQTLETKKGYKEDTDSAQRYAGSPGKLYGRLRMSKSGDFSFGVTIEKDAGEAIAWDPRRRYYAMDFISFHGQVVNKGRLQNLILGDFQAQFGQGLVLGGGFGMGKGSETITTLRRANLGFTPYASLNEFGFFRGSAMSLSLTKALTLHLLFSSLRRDALLRQDSTESSLISSFAVSGYHRTPRELETRKQIGETNSGAVLNYRRKSLDAGFLWLNTLFNVPLVLTPTVYNQFNFTGIRNCNVSAFVNFSKDNAAFFSEVAHTIGHGSSCLLGVLISLTPGLDISLLYRNFSRSFHSVYSNAVSESSTAQNETGWYWGLKYTFTKRYFVSGYVDLFRFPWLRYRSYAPSQGSEWLARFTYQPSKRATIFLQAREESKIRNLPDNNALYRIGSGVKQNAWINCDYSVSPSWSFKTRVQFSSYELAGIKSTGIALVQDVTFEAGRFMFSGRYALFDTDNYDNRLYVYERDVALAFSFPAYDGTGIRRYALVSFKISRLIDLWARWANTRYTSRDSIESGSETLAGNTKNDVKLQLRVRF